VTDGGRVALKSATVAAVGTLRTDGDAVVVIAHDPTDLIADVAAAAPTVAGLVETVQIAAGGLSRRNAKLRLAVGAHRRITAQSVV
jgi:hypothetical protein